jgi:Mg-chelatase subunit ChlD
MLPLVALLLPVLLILCSFVINIAYMELTRTELRIASDAATRAAGYSLAATQDQAQARALARDAASRNKVAGKTTQLSDADIVFGVSRRTSVNQRYDFQPGGRNVNAVSVNARRDAKSLSGVVNLVAPTFGAANQFGPAQQAISTQVECDIALVLDRSGSMAYADTESSETMAAAGQMPAAAPAGWQFCDGAPPNSRWLALVGAVDVFLNALRKSPQMEFLSLVTYSDGARRDLPLSGSYGNIQPALDAYTKSFCSGFTNIHDGIAEGVNSLNDPSTSRPWAVKVVIVLTDGRRTKGDDPVLAAQKAFAQGMTVYTVTFAKEADIGAMKAVALKGGGEHYHAATDAELKKVFSSIAGKLPLLLTR